jgi:hypothetical protein
MPKVDIDYSNTLFYKISCKDTNITDLYIGHTTNFVQRKSAHKQSCVNPKYASYNCKVYNVIREHGGWDNWRMDIIAYHDCKDLYEARKKEQEYFILHNATLNSIEPMPGPKCVNNLTLPINTNDGNSTHICDICNFTCFNTQDAYNLHLTRNRHIKAVNKLTRLSANVGQKLHKHICEPCNYTTNNKKDYNIHLLTKKHNTTEPSSSNKDQLQHNCVCGKSYKHLSGLSRHKKECHLLNCDITSVSHDEDLTDVSNTTTTQITDVPNTTTTQMVDLSLVIELFKQNQEFKELMIEQSKQLAEQQRQNKMLLEEQRHQNTQFLEAVKGGKLANK